MNELNHDGALDPLDVPDPLDDRGLHCRCGSSQLKVVYTRPRGGRKLVRRRECRECGERITTWERAVGTGRDSAASEVG